MNLQEVNRRLTLFLEELSTLQRAQRLLEQGFPFGADEIEQRISRVQKKIAMLHRTYAKIYTEESEKAAARLILAIYRQGEGAKLGKNLEELGLWRHIKRVARQVQTGIDLQKDEQDKEEEEEKEEEKERGGRGEER